MIIPKFESFGANELYLKEITDILVKVQKYTEDKKLKDATLVYFEDSRWEDPINQRFDIDIQYVDETTNHYIRQKLLILKGEVIDGETFHKRYNEFYGK